MSKILVLNHKMNLEYDEVIPYIQEINKIETKCSFIICPSNIYLIDFINHCNWGIGAQNISEYNEGDYTGEVSALQLKSIGVEYALIGHYERKKYFHETDEIIHKKLITCLESNISPILCFGESGKIEDIYQSLDTILKGIENIDFIIFAYEPLKLKEKEETYIIEEKINQIYDYLKEKYNTKPNIIYGGGINSNDIKSIINIEKLNGVLIGKISKDISKIKKIIEKKK